jgi:hypothetical protein
VPLPSGSKGTNENVDKVDKVTVWIADEFFQDGYS